MLRRFSINYAILSMALDALLVLISLRLAVVWRPFLNRYSFIQSVPEGEGLPFSLYLFFPLLWVGILSAFAIYDGRKYLRAVDEFATLSVASFVAAISMAGILYFSFREVSRALFLLFVLLSYLALLCWRAVARVGFRMVKDWPDAPRRILIVGAGPLGQRVREQIENSEIANMKCLGFVDDGAPSFTSKDHEMLGGFDQIRTLVLEHEITDVVMALPHSIYKRMSEVVLRIANLPVKVWVALGFFDLALYKTGIEDFAGIPMLDLRAPALSDYQMLVKRGFDLVIGMLAFLIAIPMMALIALVILVGDGRPILFVQKRVGENGRLFDMYKFRTMVRNAEQILSSMDQRDPDGNPVHKAKNDPRVTRTGRFLRRLSLDELPQLFNVVLGTMSLVGPRPELLHLVEKYQPWQRKRFAVPPGITGWWQVTGRSDKAMHLHTEDDLYYINNYSIWLDIQILIRTAWIVFLGKGAY
jgi:exopolysaccharide biosynthesis polyprenyl glycosylphosphotransferase